MAVGSHPVAVNPVTGALTWGGDQAGDTGAFTGEVAAQDFKVSGLTGAVNPGRFVGVTASGAPASGTFAVADFVLSQNGQMFVCTVAGSPGTWVNPRDLSDLLTTGEETLSRNIQSSTSLAPTSGNLRLSYFTARKTETSTQGRIVTGATAAGATPTLCRFGVYSVAANGDLTLLVACASDTALYAAAATPYTRSWVSPGSFAKVAGTRYAFANLVVSAAAMPSFSGTSVVTLEATTAPTLSTQISSQSDLPASISAGSMSASSHRFYAAVLP